MSDFIIGVIVDVYRHVFVKDFQSLGESFIPRTAWDFGILHTGEFVVLQPKIRLDKLQRRRKAKQCSVFRREASRGFSRVGQ